MKSAHPTARAGFTLIEIMMVVLIVGLLSGLLLVAVTAGLRRAQEAAVATEIQQLSMAIESFKSETGVYPLSMGFRLRDDRSNSSNFNADYEKRLTRTIARVFPRYAGNFGTDINQGTKHVMGGLSIDNMDAAESLVFWLGGFPDPSSETKLIGFRTDPSQPFNYIVNDQLPADDPVNFSKKDLGRKPSRFPFVPSRLVDRDGDGWWEYIPQGTASSGADMPPYAYFDGVGFDNWPAYPLPGNIDATNLAAWGTALPYANDASAKGVNNQVDPPVLPTNWKIQWMNSQKFQIIAPGRDGCYGSKLPDNYFTTATMTLPTLARDLRLLPSCQRLLPFPDNEDTERQQFLLQLDNQTNFTAGKVGDEKP